MKVKVLSKTSTEMGSKDLPAQFNEPVRSDLIKKAVLALQSVKRQSYGAMEGAGMRHSATLSRKRKDYRGSYGFGISRVQRKIMSRRGRRFNWEGAVVPGTRGGRKAHPPKSEKIWDMKINDKERQKAIRSALSATVNKELVAERGHLAPDNYPFIIQTDAETISKTAELIKVLEKLGFNKELERTSEKRVSTGKAKLRGRGKTEKKGLLILVSNPEAPILKAASNIPGVEAQYVKFANAELLAPGTHPGRITLLTEGAVDLLAKEKTFMSE